MKRELHFPTPIYHFDIKAQSLNIQLEKDVINWMNKDKGISRTNVKGWHSTTDMHTKPEYARLVKALYEAQNKIYQEENYESEPFLGNMWANVNPPGGYNRAHLHPNCTWAGVYYIKTPEKCGELKLKDPRTGAEMSSPKMKKSNTLPERLWREVTYIPVAGRCIMFPAWLIHCVEPNDSNDIRISVSFNFLQKTMFV